MAEVTLRLLEQYHIVECSTRDDSQSNWFLIDGDLGWELQQDKSLSYKILYSYLHQEMEMQQRDIMPGAYKNDSDVSQEIEEKHEPRYWIAQTTRSRFESV
ncbi:hypothetical protein E4U55_003512 [Claviceps digitariae]|nr:hypothetical protein E4U55_003512 [Claviceps digitariae]